MDTAEGLVWFAERDGRYPNFVGAVWFNMLNALAAVVIVACVKGSGPGPRPVGVIVMTAPVLFSARC